MDDPVTGPLFVGHPGNVLAMFPLGTVLLPSMLLPLHVFEGRYLRLVDDVLASEPAELGVVLIERGSEVGGGDVRVDVGCVARVVDARRAPDGRWALMCVGERRLRVVEWLDDDPYPRAVVQEWPDPVVGVADDPGLRADSEAIATVVRRVAALGAELGGPALPEPIDLSEDLSLRSHQLGVLSPLGPLDRYTLLCATGVPERLALLTEMLRDQEEMLLGRLTLGPE